MEDLQEIIDTERNAKGFEVVYGSSDGENAKIGISVHSPCSGRFTRSKDKFTGKMEWSTKHPNAVCIN